ncbi:MAG: APC family permease [Phycisphaerales bacterium]|nr:APC family permease [Phycisphaerales bacterium]
MHTSSSLQRTIGLPGAIVLGLGSMLGTGVFVALGLAAGIVGDAIWAAILVGGLLAILSGLSAARLAAAHPVSGGTYEYGYRELAPSVGVISGWLFLTAKSASAATASIGLAGYLFSPETLSGPGALLPLLPLLLATVIVLIGLRPTTWITTGLIAMSLASLLAFGWMAFTNPPVAPADPAAASPPLALGELLSAGALVFVAFTGYGRVATLGEEIRDPARAIPKAVVLTVLTATLIYLMVGMAAVRAVGGSGFDTLAATASAPLTDIATEAGANGVGTLLVFGAVAAIGGVLLNLVLGLSRVVLAMGRRGDLPGFCSSVVLGRPVIAIVVVAVTIGTISMLGSVRAAWTGSAAAVLVYYAFTNLASLRLCLRGRKRPLAAIASAAGLLACLVVAAMVPTEAWMPVGIALASGVVLTVASRLLPSTAPRES